MWASEATTRGKQRLCAHTPRPSGNGVTHATASSSPLSPASLLSPSCFGAPAPLPEAALSLTNESKATLTSGALAATNLAVAGAHTWGGASAQASTHTHNHTQSHNHTTRREARTCAAISCGRAARRRCRRAGASHCAGRAAAPSLRPRPRRCAHTPTTAPRCHPHWSRHRQRSDQGRPRGCPVAGTGASRRRRASAGAAAVGSRAGPPRSRQRRCRTPGARRGAQSPARCPGARLASPAAARRQAPCPSCLAPWHEPRGWRRPVGTAPQPPDAGKLRE